MIWLAWVAIGAAVEARAIRRHDGTLSEAIATTRRTETPHGRVAYLATLGVSAGWMAWHICRFRYSVKAH